MTRSSCVLSLGLPLALAFGSAAAAASEAVEPSTHSFILHHANVHPRSPQAARAMVGRLGDAAMEACGASSFSLREVKASIRSSQCWSDSMTEVVARIDDPMIADAYARSRQHYGRRHARSAGSTDAQLPPQGAVSASP